MSYPSISQLDLHEWAEQPFQPSSREEQQAPKHFSVNTCLETQAKEDPVQSEVEDNQTGLRLQQRIRWM